MLAPGQLALLAEVALAQHVEGVGVVRAVDDPEVLPAAHLEPGLHAEPIGQVGGLHDHALATRRGELLPPGRRLGALLGRGQVDEPVPGRGDHLALHQGELLEVPGVGLRHGGHPALGRPAPGTAPGSRRRGRRSAGSTPRRRRGRPARGPASARCGPTGRRRRARGPAAASSDAAEGRERVAGGRADRGVLPADQAERLRRPRQQLAVQDQPVGLQPLEQRAAADRSRPTRSVITSVSSKNGRPVRV